MKTKAHAVIVRSTQLWNDVPEEHKLDTSGLYTFEKLKIYDMYD